MRPAILIAALAALTAALPAAAMNPEARPQGEAMILGTYHSRARPAIWSAGPTTISLRPARRRIWRR